MEEVNQTAGEQKIKRSRGHEGPRNHIIGFVASLVLTFIAFIAVANESLNASFVIFIIVAMAIIQVLIQVTYWMHLKDRGHFYPILFLSGGALVLISMFIAALYWMWW